MKLLLIKGWCLGTALGLVASTMTVEAGEWISLINGKDKTGWHLMHPGTDGWSVRDGLLINQVPSVNIVNEVPQGDFELHIEFMVPKGSNSGVYLQGRYEIQVQDTAGFPVGNSICGAIYSKIAPKVNAAKPADEWQTFDVVFHQAVVDKNGTKSKNARVTVVHNGQQIIDDAELDGPTPAGVDDREGKPSGVMLQGDHGPVQYRNIKVRPL